MSRLRIALALGSAAVILTACSSTTTTTEPSAPAPSEAGTAAAPTTSGAIPTGYTPEVEEAFVSNCTQAATGSGTTASDAKAICGCFYRGLEATVPFEDFVAADQAAAEGQDIPQEWQQIGAACQSDTATF